MGKKKGIFDFIKSKIDKNEKIMDAFSKAVEIKSVSDIYTDYLSELVAPFCEPCEIVHLYGAIYEVRTRGKYSGLPFATELPSRLVEFMKEEEKIRDNIEM